VGKNETNTVTPPKKSLASVNGSTVSQVTTAPKMASKALIEAHKKWEKEMEAAGGKGLILIITTNEAKKVVYDMLKDAYRPMNFNDIYHHFKGSIPKVSGIQKYVL
jgi:Tat protein secretion system quality control protein TatD with DNase activity